MSAVLLDVNLLIALLWPTHEAHAHCQQWFERQLAATAEGEPTTGRRRGRSPRVKQALPAKLHWATCAITEAGFVRIVSNPAFSPDAPPAHQVAAQLAANLAHPGHQFWPDDLSLAEAVQPFLGRLYGHRQVTDAYLLGLAVQHGGQLATLDRGLAGLLPPASRLHRHLLQV